MPITNVGTLLKRMIIFAGTRSLITRVCIDAGITSDVNLADGDAHAPSMLMATWPTPTCCRRSMMVLALVLPVLISRWTMLALRYACSVLRALTLVEEAAAA